MDHVVGVRCSPDEPETPGFAAFRLLRSAMRVVDDHASPAEGHGNITLEFRSVVGLLLCAAFEPAARSLRSLDDLSCQPRVAELTGIDRAARSTLSDRLAAFSHFRPALRLTQRSRAGG